MSKRLRLFAPLILVAIATGACAPSDNASMGERAMMMDAGARLLQPPVFAPLPPPPPVPYVVPVYRRD